MKTYKYKLRKPPKRVVEKFEHALAVCCELYNAALQERRDAWRVARKSVSYYDQQKQLTEIRKIREDVKAVYAQVAQDSLNRVDKAFKSFFRRVRAGQKAGYPRFKSVNRYDSFTYPQCATGGFHLIGDRLTLPKIGSVRLRLSRPVEGRIKTCTVKREADGWYVMFAVEENQSRFFPKTGQPVGIDVGIENFATLSTGEAIANPEYLKKSEAKLKRAQRRMSRRKTRGRCRSNRGRKAVALLRKKHQKIVRQRRDFFHKLSLRLVKEFDTVVFEDLNVAGMMKNHRLAKSIGDAAWSTFILIHTSKAASAGRSVVKVPAQFTTQDCSNCGARMKLSLSERVFRCAECDTVKHRDYNAAINIKARAWPSGMGETTNPDDPRILSFQ